MVSLKTSTGRAFFFGNIVGGLQCAVMVTLTARGLPIVGFLLSCATYALGHFIYFIVTEGNDESR